MYTRIKLYRTYIFKNPKNQGKKQKRNTMYTKFIYVHIYIYMYIHVYKLFIYTY